MNNSNRSDYLLPSELAIQLISSIRELDGRIKEIGFSDNNRRFDLIFTRSCLVHSLMDLRLSINIDMGTELDYTYRDLKRDI